MLRSDRLAVALLDPDGHIMRASPGLQSAAGLPPERLFGLHFLRLISGASLPPMEALAQQAKTGATRRLRIGGPTAAQVPFDVRVTTHADGLLVVGEPLHHRDATANEQLVELTDQLTQVVQRLARERATTRTLLAERTEHMERLEAQQTDLVAMSQALSEAEENERRRLADLLHEDMAQQIFAVRLGLTALTEQSNEAPTRARLARTIQELDALSTQTRSLAHELSPPILGELGLAPALDWLCRGADGRYGLQVDFTAPDDLAEIRGSPAQVLFQGVREGLLNVARHAQSGAAEVLLARQGGWLQVEVLDAGVGPSSPGQGLGIARIQQRLRGLGGMAALEPRSTGGSRLRLRLPLS